MFDERELKVMLTEMLAWFHSFCKLHGLTYYAAGGTMLGAMRHQGFIPWDDDIDVIMPREDYNKLAEIMKISGQERYVLETPQTEAQDFYYPFSKLYDTQTTLVENSKYRPKRGIYLDIFPLDGFGQSREESLKNFKKTERIYNLLLAKVTGIRKGRNFVKNVVVAFFRIVPIDPKKILRKLVSECEKISWSQSKWGGNPVGAWRFKEIMPTEIMGTPRLYKFETIEIYGAVNADAYLTFLYGDWRKLPPVEKRKSHHDYIECDLHKSYLE